MHGLLELLFVPPYHGPVNFDSVIEPSVLVSKVPESAHVGVTIRAIDTIDNFLQEGVTEGRVWDAPNKINKKRNICTRYRLSMKQHPERERERDRDRA